jgi:hypothetical protein
MENKEKKLDVQEESATDRNGQLSPEDLDQVHGGAGGLRGTHKTPTHEISEDMRKKI